MGIKFAYERRGARCFFPKLPVSPNTVQQRNDTTSPRYIQDLYYPIAIGCIETIHTREQHCPIQVVMIELAIPKFMDRAIASLISHQKDIIDDSDAKFRDKDKNTFYNDKYN